MMLQVRDMHVRYGPIHAVHGIDLDVAAGEIVALIGANGAGKTTTVKAIAGLLPFSGSVMLDGRPVKPGAAERNLRAGISLVPEGRGILGRMTVQENLQMGIYCRNDKREAAADLEGMYQRFPILAERRSGLASLLSGGEQQMLAIARALLSRPRLLLLDEPSLGLAPKMASFVFDLILSLRETGLTVLLVEQKARHTLKIADRAYLLELGRVVTSGRAKDLANDPVISQTFLGGRPLAGEEVGARADDQGVGVSAGSSLR
ncbi:ABC transporter ATP-binding protein [Aquabacter sp. CN5-332]|uniref:ABC transporter ATP-binding protein n=1 Tax=Aquabacter sp. CN5-332 TaxID=3156608 RepID=UPI0032B3BEF3